MSFKWFVSVAMAVTLLLATGPVMLAQDSSEPQDPATTDADDTAADVSGDVPPEPAPKKRKKENRLYLEVAYGQFEADDLNSSIETRSTEQAISTFSIDENDAGRIGIGWALPRDRGRIVLRYEGYNEQNFVGAISGLQSRLINPATGGSLGVTTSEPLPWWQVNVSPDGQTAVRTPFFWDPATDDANGDGLPDLDEITQGAPDISTTNPGVASMQNQAAAIDVFYFRDFGGRRWSGEWSVGLRSFEYQGNIAAGAWTQFVSAGAGFNDGRAVRLLGMSQETSGFGPSASLGLRENFFRDRLQLYQRARAAFVSQSLETDSGQFLTLVRDTIQGTFQAANAQIGLDLNKSSWQTGFDLGLRVMMVEGFYLDLSYGISSFQDAVLLPTEISIPETTQQVNQGTSAIYNTQDLTYTGWFAGLSFQF